MGTYHGAEICELVGYSYYHYLAKNIVPII